MGEMGENTIPEEAKLVRAPTCIQRPRTWRKVDPVERRGRATARKLPRSIRPHPCHRSRITITVREKIPLVSNFTPHYLSSKNSHPSRSRYCPRGSSSKQERTEQHGRDQIEPEVQDCVCHSQNAPPWNQRLRRCLWSTQICRWRALLYP